MIKSEELYISLERSKRKLNKGNSLKNHAKDILKSIAVICVTLPFTYLIGVFMSFPTYGVPDVGLLHPALEIAFVSSYMLGTIKYACLRMERKSKA